MQLSLQNFSSLVDSMAATVQGACSALVDLTVGSVLRALLEASASVGLWLQYIALQLLTVTRLATSVGADADSWVQDFGLARLGATFATGEVTLTSLNPSAQSSTIPNGSTVRTSDGSQSFAVVNGPYSRALNTASVTVQVQALVAGSAGNVQSGTVNLLGTAIPGIDTVTNAAAFSGGGAAETDAALRTRFVTYINTRAQATEQALGYAVMSVQQNLSYIIQENVTSAGVAAPGHVNIIVDDGSGNPASAILAAVAAAVDQVRPVATTVSVVGPVLITANLTFVLTVDSAATVSIVEAAVTAALTTFVNSLGVGQALRISRLAGLCYDASSSISNVQNVSINGDVKDVGGSASSVIRIGSIGLSAVSS